MRKDFLPFSKPSITEADIASVADVLRSGWITTGPKSAQFEKNFSEYIGCKSSIALSSATAGMHLAMAALKIGPGDEVITPSMTWVSTANMITLAGATPVFADVDKDTLMVTAESIEKCITPKTRLIIPVHYAGAAADMDSITELAKKHGIGVLEDCAHAVGTHYKGQQVGKDSTSIFSFHAIKNLTTAEGGMFCSNDEELLEHVRRLKFHGLGVDSFDRKMQGRAPQAQVIEPGYKYNMTDISAVIGINQLAAIDEINACRTELAMRYRELLEDVEEVMPLSDPDYPIKHAWHLFIVRVDTKKTGITRNDFMDRLKKKNIGTGLHFYAVHLQKYYTEVMGTSRGTLPNTEWNSDRICSLPLFPGMVIEDVDDVAVAIKEVISEI